MNELLPGQGGAYEISTDGAVTRVEGTRDVPAPLPPTSTPVEPEKKPAAASRALAAVKHVDDTKGNIKE
jgi:hypothetical protein